MSEAKKIDKPLSILDRIKGEKAVAGKKHFGVVTGRRLSGKTTLAGTLTGRTLLMQASVLESGSDSAKRLAAKLGNELHVANFANVAELMKYIKELEADKDFDNIYIDGVTAITEQLTVDPKIAALTKKNNWDGFRELGSEVRAFMHAAKNLTYPGNVSGAKNVFVTVSLKTKTDTNGNIIDVEMEAKGNVAVSEITKLGEGVYTLVKVQTEEGEQRKLLTKSQGYWPGRIDGILDEDNPAIIEPNLSQVLALLNSKQGAK